MLLGAEVVGRAVTDSTRESASTKAEVQVLKDMASEILLTSGASRCVEWVLMDQVSLSLVRMPVK